MKNLDQIDFFLSFFSFLRNALNILINFWHSFRDELNSKHLSQLKSLNEPLKIIKIEIYHFELSHWLSV